MVNLVFDYYQQDMPKYWWGFISTYPTLTSITKVLPKQVIIMVTKILQGN